MLQTAMTELAIPSERTAKVSIWIVSDIHCQEPKPNSIFRYPLPKCDILVVPGDLSDTGKLFEYEKVLDWVKACDAELKIVIPGNHDISLDPTYYKRKGPYFHSNKLVSLDAAEDLWTNSTARDAGIVFLKESTQTLSLKSKGVSFKVHASPYQPEFHDWAFNHPRDEDRYNPLPDSPTKTAVDGVAPIPEGIDILISHGPPKGINDLVEEACECPHDGCSHQHVGCQYLFAALERVRPRLHVFGHIHEGFGATRVQWKQSEKTRKMVPEELEPPKPEELKKKADHTDACASWYIDVSKGGGRPLRIGKETLCVNASLVDKYSNIRSGGVLVDIELPVAREF